jgi:hypothetical protein
LRSLLTFVIGGATVLVLTMLGIATPRFEGESCLEAFSIDGRWVNG